MNRLTFYPVGQRGLGIAVSGRKIGYVAREYMPGITDVVHHIC
ncbi:TPA: hypothetical protein ACNIQM_002913 [Citrobacter werkmanii]